MKEIMTGVGLPSVYSKIYPVGHVDVVTGKSSGVKHVFSPDTQPYMVPFCSYDDEPR